MTTSPGIIISRTGTSANNTLGFLRRNIRTKDLSIREVAYKTLVRPILEYSPVWSPHTMSNIVKSRWYRGELHARLCVVSLRMIVFQTCWVNLGWGLLGIGVQTPGYVCFIRLCMVLLQCHFHHIILRCLQDIQHHIC